MINEILNKLVFILKKDKPMLFKDIENELSGYRPDDIRMAIKAGIYRNLIKYDPRRGVYYV